MRTYHGLTVIMDHDHKQFVSDLEIELSRNEFTKGMPTAALRRVDCADHVGTSGLQLWYKSERGLNEQQVIDATKVLLKYCAYSFEFSIGKK